MRRLVAVILIGGLATALFCGCRISSAGGNSSTLRRYMTDAVLASLSDMFDGSWGDVTIYVQKSAWVPEDLKQAGKNRVELTSASELAGRYTGAGVAPAIAIVDASQDKAGIITVTVKYAPVRIKGLEPSTKGGTFEYIYRLADGRLILMSRLKPIL